MPTIVPIPGFPGEEANRSTIQAGVWTARLFRLRVTDAFDRTGTKHKSPGHLKSGTAWDFSGSDSNMDKAVKWLVDQGYTVLYDGRFGSQAVAGHGPSTVAGSNAHLHVEFDSGPGPGAFKFNDRGAGPGRQDLEEAADTVTDAAGDVAGAAVSAGAREAIDVASSAIKADGGRVALYVALVGLGMVLLVAGISRATGLRASSAASLTPAGRVGKAATAAKGAAAA